MLESELNDYMVECKLSEDAIIYEIPISETKVAERRIPLSFGSIPTYRADEELSALPFGNVLICRGFAEDAMMKGGIGFRVDPIDIERNEENPRSIIVFFDENVSVWGTFDYPKKMILGDRNFEGEMVKQPYKREIAEEIGEKLGGVKDFFLIFAFHRTPPYLLEACEKSADCYPKRDTIITRAPAMGFQSQREHQLLYRLIGTENTLEGMSLLRMK